jgi:hypothetical protein
MTNYELMLKILERMGAPPKLCSAVDRPYTTLQVLVEICNLKETFEQGVGVHQGDNIAPVLFLFLMTALSEIYDRECEEEGIKQPSFLCISPDKLYKGQLMGESRLSMKNV